MNKKWIGIRFKFLIWFLFVVCGVCVLRSHNSIGLYVYSVCMCLCVPSMITLEWFTMILHFQLREKAHTIKKEGKKRTKEPFGFCSNTQKENSSFLKAKQKQNNRWKWLLFLSHISTFWGYLFFILQTECLPTFVSFFNTHRHKRTDGYAIQFYFVSMSMNLNRINSQNGICAHFEFE